MANIWGNYGFSTLPHSEKIFLENWFDFETVKDKNNSNTAHSKMYFRCKFSFMGNKEIIKSGLRCIRLPPGMRSQDYPCYEMKLSNISGYSMPMANLRSSQNTTPALLCLLCEIEFATVADGHFDHASGQLDSNKPKFSLSGDFDNLWKNKLFADITFLVNDKEFQVHKLILAARSPVFKAMFEQPLIENLTNRVTVDDMEPEVFEEMLRYVYTGKCENLDQLSGGLLMAADKYDLEGLKVMCERAQFKSVDYENALSVLLSADLYHADSLKSNVIGFIVAASAKFINTAAWKTMAKNHPHLIAEVCNAMSDRLTNALALLQK